jgi:putative ABC transport system permease protein
MLQAVGAGRLKVAGLFLGEALLICGTGCALGLFMGQWLASWAVQLTAQTVETFYIADVAQSSAQSLRLGPTEIALALGSALPLSLIAAAIPALQAASIRPVEVIRGAGRLVAGFRPPIPQLLVGALLLAVGGVFAQMDTIGGLPIFGFAAGFFIVLGGAFIVPLTLWLGCQVVRGRPARLLPARRMEFRLAGSNLLGAIGRLSISVSALAVSLAMMVAIAVLVGSFRETVAYWLNRTLSADLFVRPTMLTSSTAEGSIGRGTRETLLQDPDVVSIGWITTRQVAYGDTRIRLAATSFTTLDQHRQLLFKSPRNAWQEVAGAARSDRVLVSESFAIRYGKSPGEAVELPTRHGPQRFEVAAVYYDYASNQGTVMVDAETYRRHFAESAEELIPSGLSIYVRSGADLEAVRARLADSVGSGQDLYFASNQDVRREAMRIFDSTFAITYALEVIAIIIAGLGVISTLITLIYERQREIALLSIVGATRRQIRWMVVIEAGLLGAVSQLIGVLIGIALAVLLIFVVNVQSFGWTIQFHIPWWFLAHSTLIILVVTSLCGLYPATRAASIEAVRVVREE